MKYIRIYRYNFAYNYMCTYSFSVLCVGFDVVHMQTKFRRFPTLHKSLSRPGIDSEGNESCLK